MEQSPNYDVAVIGAGTAGLQAALTLGRMRRRVLLLDAGSYRNDPAVHMQNFLGHDGEPPSVLREAAHRNLDRYATVERRNAEVISVDGAPDAFTLQLAHGAPITSRRVLLATGVVDDLPPVPGLSDLFGTCVAHCPYCHGFELADGPIGLLGVGAHLPMMAQLISRLATSVTVFANGGTLDDGTAAALDALGVEVRGEAVRAVESNGDGMRVLLDEPVELSGMFVHTAWRQAAPFAEQLGLEMGEMGGVLVDALGATSRPGVYAAGDLAHHRELPMPLASVLTAASAGLVAGSACDRELAMAEVATAVTRSEGVGARNG